MLNDGTYKTTKNNMHNLGWKAQFFKSADVSILGHGCGVSQYPLFYDQIKKYQMLPRPYNGSYPVDNGHQFLIEPWIIALSQSVEIFVMVKILAELRKFVG